MAPGEIRHQRQFARLRGGSVGAACRDSRRSDKRRIAVAEDVAARTPEFRVRRDRLVEDPPSVVHAFRAVQHRSPLDREPAAILLHGLMRLNAADGHVHDDLDRIALPPHAIDPAVAADGRERERLAVHLYGKVRRRTGDGLLVEVARHGASDTPARDADIERKARSVFPWRDRNPALAFPRIVRLLTQLNVSRRKPECRVARDEEVHVRGVAARRVGERGDLRDEPDDVYGAARRGKPLRAPVAAFRRKGIRVEELVSPK